VYPNGYDSVVFQTQQTDVFAEWLAYLKDRKAKARILSRLESVMQGNLGDTKGVGGGVRELRVHVGPGYRVYFAQIGPIVLLLLCGGDKSTQKRDTERARRLLRDAMEE
jgi:putative addiction module killer protein